MSRRDSRDFRRDSRDRQRESRRDSRGRDDRRDSRGRDDRRDSRRDDRRDSRGRDIRRDDRRDSRGRDERRESIHSKFNNNNNINGFRKEINNSKFSKFNKKKDDEPLLPVVYIDTKLVEIKKEEEKIIDSSLPQTIDNNQNIDQNQNLNNEEEIDMEELNNFEEFFTKLESNKNKNDKKRKLDVQLSTIKKNEDEDEEIIKRRKRLEEIKLKFQNHEQEQPNKQEEQLKKEIEHDDTSNIDLLTSNNNKNNNITKEDEVDQLNHIKILKERETTDQTHQNQSNFYDIFSDSPTALPVNPSQQLLKTNLTQTLKINEEHLQGNFDDKDGYYKPIIGDVINDQYKILGVIGKGVFASVLKCEDLKDYKEDSSSYGIVAIKLIRNNEIMKKTARKELIILKHISTGISPSSSIVSSSTSNNTKNRSCINLIDSINFRNHMGFIFPFYELNLRETLKKFGQNVGINIKATKVYGKQLFSALKYLKELKIIHADIKPDNILCSSDLKTVKLCDFGNSFYEHDYDNVPTPYLVSRFYRAPEIILGMKYDYAVDMWSICTTLYELFTGEFMFPGRTNNEMLKLIMKVKGPFPIKMIKSHRLQYQNILNLPPLFDNNNLFLQEELDPITNKIYKKSVDITQPENDLRTILRASSASTQDLPSVNQFASLLEEGLALDPTKRLCPFDGIKHPFFKLN